MSEPMAYIARKDCGCIVMATVDEGHNDTNLSQIHVNEHRKHTAKDISDSIREGYIIERVTCDYVRKTPWLCQTHQAEKDKKDVLDRMQGRLIK